MTFFYFVSEQSIKSNYLNREFYQRHTSSWLCRYLTPSLFRSPTPPHTIYKQR